MTCFIGAHCPPTVSITAAALLPPQSESEGFSHFHLYVCAAFLLEWRKEILSMVDFQVWNSLLSRKKMCFSRTDQPLNIHFNCHRVASKVLIAKNWKRVLESVSFDVEPLMQVTRLPATLWTLMSAAEVAITNGSIYLQYSLLTLIEAKGSSMPVTRKPSFVLTAN